tara:strand:+ start:877 stop:1188 length:312 start_codon:yes stop_codon:yes gene_type:complete
MRLVMPEYGGRDSQQRKIKGWITLLGDVSNPFYFDYSKPNDLGQSKYLNKLICNYIWSLIVFDVVHPRIIAFLLNETNDLLNISHPSIVDFTLPFVGSKVWRR